MAYYLSDHSGKNLTSKKQPFQDKNRQFTRQGLLQELPSFNFANQKEGGVMESRDQVSSLVGLVLSVSICIESFRLPIGIGTWRYPGRDFPLGPLIRVASAWGEPPGSLGRGRILVYQGRWKKLVLILAILLSYAFILENLGYVFSTFLLLFFLLRFVEAQRWLVTVAGSLLVSLVSYGVFDKWLKMQLPKGIWGF
jgi:putative tricarboxylic transport membrane protein